jgi:hypothetical protein
MQETIHKRHVEYQVGRDHVLVVPGMLDLSPNITPAWPPSKDGLLIKHAATMVGTAATSSISAGYAQQPLLVLPTNSSGGHLQLRNLQLRDLPQGPPGDELNGIWQRKKLLQATDPMELLPAREWTLILWFISR